MSDRIDAAWARVRAIDAAVARSTADGTSFDRGVEQGATRLHDLRNRAQQAVGARIPEGARTPLARAGAGLRRGLDLVNTEPTGLAGAAIVGAAYPLAAWERAFEAVAARTPGKVLLLP